MTEERRTFNTPLRAPLNPIIYRILQAIDWHNSQFFKDGNLWHVEQTAILRQYVKELKTWVHAQEAKAMESGGESARPESRKE